MKVYKEGVQRPKNYCESYVVDYTYVDQKDKYTKKASVKYFATNKDAYDAIHAQFSKDFKQAYMLRIVYQ